MHKKANLWTQLTFTLMFKQTIMHVQSSYKIQNPMLRLISTTIIYNFYCKQE